MAGFLHNLFRGSSSWLTSLCLHIVIILLLALWSLPSLPELTLNNLIASTDSDELEDFSEIPQLDFEDLETELEVQAVDFSNETDIDIQPITEPLVPADVVFTELAEVGFTALSSEVVSTSAKAFGRSEASKKLLSKKKGGTAASERAITLALAWLARHQNPDGTWSLAHHEGPCRGRCDNPSTAYREPERSLRGATALALLPFLGAGQTHETGKYKQVIKRGLAALVNLGRPNNKGPGISYYDNIGQASYSHAIATLALAEALGLSDDQSLRGPAQGGIDYIAFTQKKDGGWSYRPNRGRSDTSIVGWHLQAMKSGFIANLNISPQVARQGFGFLDKASFAQGARYSYFPRTKENLQLVGANKITPKATLAGVGLLSRIYQGWPRDHPGLTQGVKLIAKKGPSVTGVEANFYSNYYDSQVLFQHTSGEGEMWTNWNDKLRDFLVASQDTKGHQRGSWFATGGHGKTGGRLYVTSLATLTLEVYYRYLPIYDLNTESLEFGE